MKPPSPYCSVIAEVITRLGSTVPASASGWKSGLRSSARAAAISEPALDRAFDQPDLHPPQVVVELPRVLVAAIPAPDRQSHDGGGVVEADPGTWADPGLHAGSQLLWRGTRGVVDQEQLWITLETDIKV